ncbi:MAG: hypothetical protein SH859_16325 [Hyphomicrobium aestuarii]|nr:hypothetical protein [Hyphomicrobium aestuarii]
MSANFSTTLKAATAALALTILGAAVPGAVTPAEAKKGFKGHGHHFFIGHFPRRHFYGPRYHFAGYGDCYGLKRKAFATGSPYWWARYRDCRGY